MIPFIQNEKKSRSDLLTVAEPNVSNFLLPFHVFPSSFFVRTTTGYLRMQVRLDRC